MDEDAWQRKSTAILTDIKEWRQAHPTATFVEIEAEVHRGLMELEAQVLQCKMRRRRVQAVSGDTPQGRLAQCVRRAAFLWKHEASTCAPCKAMEDKASSSPEPTGPARSVELVFFPLDEELGLLPGTLAPRQHEHLVHLASCLPFKQAARMLGTLLGVQISAETARRLTEQTGACMEAAQTAEADTPAAPESTDQPALERCVVSVDGAMISLVHQQWVEVRTLAIGQPQKQHGAGGESEVHVDQLSYFSRLADASTFTELANVEMRRRQVREAEHVCAVTDGADWCQAFTERHRPDALRILDFPHAAEHVSKLLEALQEAGLPVPDQMLSRCLHVLKRRGPRPLLRMADQLGNALTQRKGVQEHPDYLRKRETLMEYPAFRDQGWPIGSGMVESANKNVVEARLKGTGMHWERTHVNPMLALRTTVCNDRWREMWGRALTSHRKQQALHRSARATSRAQAFLAGGEASSQASPPPPSAAIAEQVSPPAPSQLVVEAEASTLPPPPVPEASQPSPCRLSRRRTRQRVNCSRRSSSHVNADVCLCGMPLVRFKGHRPKQYCSDRCRQRAHRSRQAPIPAHLALARQFKRQARHGQGHRHLQRSPQSFVRKDPQTCPCGTPLVREKGHRPREYCSDRCRQRARRERQAQWS